MAPVSTPHTAKNILAKGTPFGGELSSAGLALMTTITLLQGFAFKIFESLATCPGGDPLNMFLSAYSADLFKKKHFLLNFVPFYLKYWSSTPQARQELLLSNDWPLSEPYAHYFKTGDITSPRRSAARANPSSPEPANSSDDELAPDTAERVRSQTAGRGFISDASAQLNIFLSTCLIAFGAEPNAPIRGIFCNQIAPLVILIAASTENPTLIAFLDSDVMKNFTIAALLFLTAARHRVGVTTNGVNLPVLSGLTPLQLLHRAEDQDRLINDQGLPLADAFLGLPAGSSDNIMLSTLVQNLRLCITAKTVPPTAPANAAATAAAKAGPNTQAAAPTTTEVNLPTNPPPPKVTLDQLRVTFGSLGNDYLANAELGMPSDLETSPALPTLPTAGAAGSGATLMLAPVTVPPSPTADLAAIAAAVAVECAGGLKAHQTNTPPVALYMKKVDKVCDNVSTRNAQSLGQEDPLTLKASTASDGTIQFTKGPRPDKRPLSSAEFTNGSAAILWDIWLPLIPEAAQRESLMRSYNAYVQHVLRLYLIHPFTSMLPAIQAYDTAVREMVFKGKANWDDSNFGDLFNNYIAIPALRAASMQPAPAASRGDFRASARPVPV